ncbi:uncharacterized membrane protein YheB (UPF0754 family) [Amycolatopsis bartoniae]|uniref:DUF445 domain-containing protein n=1 Tax=Amycolatopsis bartoniae TaxID=941986 RepID=A0A8H9ME28_9PSEU|nr:DUF445 domain-containing protein [Amycolatopsis bartoniae]MBB2935109.1 uncharacterized membrane protein YheB (UPF0754 family) [Amycolatopsis bartoniae]TVT06989.1 DUF445 domain-containing protein [Amycolatopsis bartoniae]GHF74417.1 hypothetical protein GCM10017566_55270 [Amycolatopsis bartoniae]
MAQDLAAHWPLYLAIPFVGALIGYVTKRVAIEMMFRPLEFVGLRPWLGWQGVVPKHGGRMAAIATDLLTSNLIDLREVFARVDADRLTAVVEQPLLRAIDDITRDVLAQYHPRLWEAMPSMAQELVVKQVQAAAPRLVRELVADLRENLTEVLDVKHMTVQRLTRDKALLVRLIRGTTRPEMRFIARCGIYSGFGLGVVQAVLWALTKNPWVLPVFGGCIGLFTDWLAIKLIFLPREPVRVLGLTLQGKFQRRRREVARDYGELIAHEVLTTPNLLEAVLRGPRADQVVTMVRRTVSQAVDEQAGRLVALTIGTARLREMKEAAATRALALLPDTVRHAERYLTEAMDVAHMVEQRMLALTPVEYEGLLRPAFRQEEWKLIAVGGVIGFVVGELQVLLMLH